MMSIDLKCEAKSSQGLLKDVDYQRMELSGFYSHGPAVGQLMRSHEPLYSTTNIQERKIQKLGEENLMKPWRVNQLDGVNKEKGG